MFFNKFIWIILIILIIIIGIFFSIKFKFLQFNFKKIISSIKSSRNLSTLFLSLSGKIGVGSIAGIALSIYVGGCGTIFWIWIFSLITAVFTYVEVNLSIKYKNTLYGGPAYYIKKGLNNKKLGSIYSILLFLTYVVGIISIQTNTIIKSFNDTFEINTVFVILILCALCFTCILKGIKSIKKITNIIIPILITIYLLLTLYILISNYSIILETIALIIEDAFNFTSFQNGFIATIIISAQRSVFSNEAGLGTTSILTFNSENEDESYLQILNTYITTFIICTSTAIIVIMSNYNNIFFNDINGIEIANLAFKYHLGNFGNIILTICIFMFAFSTILAAYYYGESSLNYFNIKNNICSFLLKIFTISIIIINSFLSANIIWIILDIFIGLIGLINIYSMYKLRNKVTI